MSENQPSQKNGQLAVYNFICDYCHKGFRFEGHYLNHECEIMRREKMMKTLHGQIAFQYYKTWMGFNKKTVHKIETFMTSKYYIHFIKFEAFVRRTNMADPSVFLKLMVTSTFPPSMWINDQVYSIYLNYLDKKLKPLDHFKISVTTIMGLRKQYNCQLQDVFNNINPEHLQSLLRSRNISPWFLLNSEKFMKALRTYTQEDRTILSSLIGVDLWLRKFKKHANDVIWMKETIKSMKL